MQASTKVLRGVSNHVLGSKTSGVGTRRRAGPHKKDYIRSGENKNSLSYFKLCLVATTSGTAFAATVMAERIKALAAHPNYAAIVCAGAVLDHFVPVVPYDALYATLLLGKRRTRGLMRRRAWIARGKSVANGE